MRILPRGYLAWIRFTLLAGIPIVLLSSAYLRVMYMPGSSYKGDLPLADTAVKEIRERLEVHVHKLANDFGPRNLAHPENLEGAVRYVCEVFSEIGYTTMEHEYLAGQAPVKNIDVEREGSTRKNEIVLVGAHYDTQTNSPGADDNASGVAGLLEVARLLDGPTFERTIRYVAFVCEEPPYFHKPIMGSLVYARRCREREEKIVAMISLESIGWYSEEKGSQKYPRPYHLLFPKEGDFIGFVGNTASGPLVRQAIQLFRKNVEFPSEGIVAPDRVPGAGWSDHWSFWQEGYPGIMVTDTALYRNDYYHTPEDTADRLDYDRMARVVAGMAHVVAGLAGDN